MTDRVDEREVSYIVLFRAQSERYISISASLLVAGMFGLGREKEWESRRERVGERQLVARAGRLLGRQAQVM